jgi:hypothetical protein
MTKNSVCRSRYRKRPACGNYSIIFVATASVSLVAIIQLFSAPASVSLVATMQLFLSMVGAAPASVPLVAVMQLFLYMVGVLANHMLN